MPVVWKGEACDQHPDPETGVSTVRLTQSSFHSINIYCEQPYTSPDGRRIAIMRSPDPDPRLPPYELLVADVYSLRITSMEKNAASILVGTAAWSGWIYYTTPANELMRFHLETLEKEVVWTRWPYSPDFVMQSVSADLRYLIGILFNADYKSQIIRVDLREKTSKVIFEYGEALSHLQFCPVPGKPNDILVQLNRRQSYDPMWDHRAVENAFGGATHFIIDENGKNKRDLAIGEPVTISSAGHAAWIADTGRICVASHFNGESWTLDPRWPTGNLFHVGPGEARPTVIDAPGHRFNHVSVSRCGKYFVCDSYPRRLPDKIALVVGNLKTGKWRPLLNDCLGRGGGAAASHPHAYFTADNKHVIYNADPYWIGHVFAARVPAGFLESLD